MIIARADEVAPRPSQGGSEEWPAAHGGSDHGRGDRGKHNVAEMVKYLLYQ
jgi:hypothetical protein